MAIATYFSALTLLVVGLIWLGIAIFLRAKQGKSLVYLLFFTVFYIYLYKVLDYTLIQYQSLLLLKQFAPNLILNGQAVGQDLNLFPLIMLTREDVTTSLLNILLFVPFGFGLPFLTRLRMGKVVALGMCLSIAIELVQFATGRIAGTAFRVADVNDVIFNTAGVAIGYLLFVVFVRLCRRLARGWEETKNPLIHYIVFRPQVGDPSRR